MDLLEISKKEQVEKVVNKHYELLLKDPKTSEVFQHLKLEKHLPRIYDFWCFVLQINPEENQYRGSVFEPHTKLNLKAEHFDIWLGHLAEALEPFQGSKAKEWMGKANQQAILFKYKLGLEPQQINIKKR